jgi:hypothetical protein
MEVDEIITRLADHDRLAGELAAVRAAPAPIREQLAGARAMLERRQAQFQAAPLQVPSTAAVPQWILGLMMEVAPQPLLVAIEKHLRNRLGDAETLGAADRARRTAELEGQLGTVLRMFDPGDLRRLKSRAEACHAIYRGLRTRQDELAQRVQRRERELAAYVEQLAEIGRPPPRVAHPVDALDQAPPPAALTPADREELRAAADWQLAADQAELAADREQLAEISRQTDAAAADWRKWSGAAEQVQDLLRRPIPVAA